MHASDPNMPHILAVALIHEFGKASQTSALCFIRRSKHVETIKELYCSLELQKIVRFGHAEYVMKHLVC